jgi:hypothetical protein
VTPIECPTCHDEGWVTESEHGCDGTEAVCLTTCPIPIHAPCPDCCSAPTPTASVGEVPF